MRACPSRLPSSPARHRICLRAAPGGGSPPQAQLKRIILLRHAESKDIEGVRDHDRPVSDQGRKQAAQVARMLKERGWTPDLVLASNSKRTKQTLDEMAEVMHELADVDAHFYGSLYTVAALDGQTRDHILECLLEVCDDAKNRVIMCVGHNKGWEEAASQLAGQAVKLRTASAALLQCYAPSWKDVLKLPSSKEEGVEQQAGPGVAAGAATVQWHLVEVVTPQVV